MFFKSLFKLPSPKELGISDSDYLPSRALSLNVKGPTWEDWNDIVKNRYPIKYFILESIPSFYREIFVKKYRNFIYWLTSHLFPSKRHHYLDLRQPENHRGIDSYKYGWSPVSERMLYAMFNLLEEYLSSDDLIKIQDLYSEEEINNNPELKNKNAAFKEAKALYYWWHIERKAHYHEYHDIFEEWSKCENIDPNKINYFFEKLSSKEKFIEESTIEMTIRLMKIRPYLWD